MKLKFKKVVKYVRSDETIMECEKCTNDLGNLDILNFIQHATKVMEKEFMNICHEGKLSKKVEMYFGR